MVEEGEDVHVGAVVDQIAVAGNAEVAVDQMADQGQRVSRCRHWPGHVVVGVGGVGEVDRRLRRLERRAAECDTCDRSRVAELAVAYFILCGQFELVNLASGESDARGTDRSISNDAVGQGCAVVGGDAVEGRAVRTFVGVEVVAQPAA